MGGPAPLELEVRTLRGEVSRLTAELADAKQRLAYIASAAGAPVVARGPRIPDPEVRDRRRLNAMKARCSVGKLSDEARREALDKAYDAGALDPIINELSLPWKSEDLALDPRVDPVRAKTIIGASGGLFDLTDVEYNYWMMSRLARLSPGWKRIRKTVVAGWDQMRARSDPDEDFYHPGYIRAATAESAWFPSGTTAVSYDSLFLANSTRLRFGTRWYTHQQGYLSGSVVYDENSESLVNSKLAKDARKRSRRKYRIARKTLARHGDEVLVLALMELAYG